MNITDILSKGALTAAQLIEETEIPRTTLLRLLDTLIEEGNVVQDGKLYKLAKIAPSAHEILNDLEIIYQQKLMDRVFRRKDSSNKSDEVLQWYIDFQLKNKIEDYNEKILMDRIHEGWSMFMKKHSLDYTKV